MHITLMKYDSDPLATAFDKLFDAYGNGAEEGYVPTAREDIKFFWNKAPVPRGPRIYDPGIVIIGKGYKLGYQGERRFRYDADNCLVLSLPSAFESETDARPESPLFGLFVNVDRMLVVDLAQAMGLEQGARLRDIQPSFEPVPLAGSLRESAIRFAAALADPDETAAIGEALKRELVYRTLRSPGAEGLLLLTHDGSVNARISRVLNRVHSDFETPFTVDELAHEAGMSLSSFHRSFRQVTGDSPLQYIKKVRLHRARTLIAEGGMRPGEAAGHVGYASISQFSREFSRHFDRPPSSIRAA